MILNIIIPIIAAAITIYGLIKSEKKLPLSIILILIFLYTGFQIWETVTKEEPVTKKDIVSLNDKISSLEKLLNVEKQLGPELDKYFKYGYVLLAINDNNQIKEKIVRQRFPYELETDDLVATVDEKQQKITIGNLGIYSNSQNLYIAPEFDYAFSLIPITIEEAISKQHLGLFGFKESRLVGFTSEKNDSGYIFILGFHN